MASDVNSKIDVALALLISIIEMTGPVAHIYMLLFDSQLWCPWDDTGQIDFLKAAHKIHAASNQADRSRFI